jgi:hypothetical protein
MRLAQPQAVETETMIRPRKPVPGAATADVVELDGVTGNA